ncbi:MAG: hypothetical protein Q8O47_02290 [Candidatus Bathyarchaeota archaeon]|nr:hypothetical protein [Candidatus Bathyarchaeota archaeon]
MNLRLLASTPAVETLIATAMLTTMSGAAPSSLYSRLIFNPTKVAEIVGRLEVQHGSILEHNRLNWLLEAGEGEVLKVLLVNRFFTFTRFGSNQWLVSANLRTVIEYATLGDEFGDLLLESIREKLPSVYAFGRRGR